MQFKADPMKTSFFSYLKCVAAIALCLLLSNTAIAVNYYFSSVSGDDSRTAAQARNPSTPWKTIDKLNSIFSQLNPGDSVLFRSGDTFYGSIAISRSGSGGSPISFSSYGNGAKPEITGFSALTAWNSAGSNIWETTIPAAQQRVNSVLVNGNFQRVGRYPNGEQQYLTIQSTANNNYVTDPQLASGPNWSGGEIVIRKARWVIDRNMITQHSGSTINYNTQSGYGASNGYGYFIQNHPQTLDQEGEWYYQASGKKMGLYATSNPTGRNVRASTIDLLVAANGRSNLSFSNLAFTGANTNAFDLRNSQNIAISGCDITFSGVNAIYASSTHYLQVQGCTIRNTNNIACNMTGCNNTTVQNCRITSTAVYAGMGDGDAGSYEAILHDGYDLLVASNTIDSTGYVPIIFRGDNVLVRNNVVTNYAFVKDDGGGIYTWNNLSNAPVYTNRKIIDNIVLYGRGAGQGTPNPESAYAEGIYMDDNAGGVTISGNTVAYVASYGLYIHNAHDLQITGNTVYDNKIQLEVVEDDIAPARIRNVTMTRNKFISKTASQTVAEFKTNENGISRFGYFDNNYYARPIDDNLTIGVLSRATGSYVWQMYDLNGWKAAYGLDANSKKSAVTIAPYRVTGTVGSNLYGNGSFNSNINGLYIYSNAGNATTTWNNGALDGGTLQVNFSSTAGNANKGNVIIEAGTITANRKYLLKFSVKGASGKTVSVYLRKNGAPYNDVTERQYFALNGNRQEREMLFTANASVSDGRIAFEMDEQSTPVYFDNVQLTEVNAITTNPDDSMRLVYNPQASTQTFPLDGLYADVAGNAYNNNITLDAYRSAVLIKKSSVQTDPQPPAVACTATGSILREQWNNTNGNNISDIPVQTTPSSSGQLNIFEGPTDLGDNYASRIRGYICPPQTGNYIFWIAGDDATELWLSTDSLPAGKIRIAYSLSWTSVREWNKFSTQRSASINLQAGRKYYIEALHKEGSSSDHLSVAWQLPDGTFQGPIPGDRLSPFTGTTNLTAQTISFPSIATKTYGDAPFNLAATASSGLAVSFRVVSGPATIAGSTVTLTGTGTVVIEAAQSGNSQYSAATPVQQSFVVNAPASVNCSATGTILREQWTNAGGNNISDIPLQTNPATSDPLSLFEGPTDIGDNYASRIRGYICPPQTGNYTFWIAGDDATELWLSTDSLPASKTRIAYSLSWTSVREWNKFSTQRSASINLQAGRKYYIEALHKEGGGGDHLSVAWQLPDGTFQGPIPGNRLSPFTGTTNLTAQTISFPAIATKTYGDAPFNLAATASSGLAVSFRVVSGPATVSGTTCTLSGTGTVVLEASQAGNTQYSAAVPVQQSFAVTASTTPPVACTGTGSIFREQWNNIEGHNISSIPVNTTPAGTLQLTSFESPTDYGDNYGVRIRGYICPPQTGNYTFWVAADDVAELWLSNSDAVVGRSLIASVPAWTGVREWNKFASQKSATVYLQAGQRYYIEALHKEGSGGDNLAVAWQLPNGTFQGPIPGTNLVPFTTIPVVTTPCPNTGSIVWEQWGNINGYDVNSIPVTTTPNNTIILTRFEAPTDYGDNYGARVRGYICPPQTGNYIFWIAGDNMAELWLSNSAAANGKVKIANVPDWTSPREWNKFATQQSGTIYLQAGQRYYIEALQKEGGGGDHLAVAWQLPDGVFQAPIAGTALSPFESGASTAKQVKTVDWSSVSAVPNKLTATALLDTTFLKVYPNPVRNTAVIEAGIKANTTATIDLYDEHGRLIRRLLSQVAANKLRKKIAFDVQGLAKGVYLLRMATTTEIITEKMVVQ